LLPQVAEGELDRAAGLRVGDDGDRARVLVAAEHVLRVVQPRAGEPLRAGHRPRSEHALVPRVCTDPEVVPERGPEALDVGDRPAQEVVVVAEPAVEPREVTARLGPVAPVGGRAPEDVPLSGHQPAACTSVPPSTRYAPPVMKLDAGDASSRTRPFSSSGSA